MLITKVKTVGLIFILMFLIIAHAKQGLKGNEIEDLQIVTAQIQKELIDVTYQSNLND